MVNLRIFVGDRRPDQRRRRRDLALRFRNVRAAAQQFPGRRPGAAWENHRRRVHCEPETGGRLARQRRDGVGERGAPQGQIGSLRSYRFELGLGALGVDGRRYLGVQPLLREVERGLVEFDRVGVEFGLRVQAAQRHVIAGEFGVQQQPRVGEGVA